MNTQVVQSLIRALHWERFPVERKQIEENLEGEIITWDGDGRPQYICPDRTWTERLCTAIRQWDRVSVRCPRCDGPLGNGRPVYGPGPGIGGVTITEWICQRCKGG